MQAQARVTHTLVKKVMIEVDLSDASYDPTELPDEVTILIYLPNGRPKSVTIRPESLIPTALIYP